MDSFYDAPRRAPMPTKVEKFLPAPVVPEVSIVCPLKYSSYNSWKVQQNRSDMDYLAPSKQNLTNLSPAFSQNQCVNTSQMLKKQVRFESPILQQRPSLTYEPFNARRNGIPNVPNAPVINKPPKVIEQGSISPLNGQTFEQMYLANVPNRNLDLSLIDLPMKSKKEENLESVSNDKQAACCNTDCKRSDGDIENKENMLPKTYREFLETQKKIDKETRKSLNDSITDIFNYKRKAFNAGNVLDPKKSESYLPEPNLQKTDSAIPINSVINNNSKPIVKNSVERQHFHDNRYSEFKQQGFQEYARYAPKCGKVTQVSVYRPPNDREVDKKSTENNSEPTNRDLLKIIAQQNEQLLILQRQVAMLLDRDQQCHAKQIEAPPRVLPEANCVKSTQNEAFRSPMRDLNNTPRKQRGLSKFSIDVMTSFEVAVRPQHKQNFVNQEPKIQEITETESEVRDESCAVDKYEKTLVDSSLHLQEPLRVREVCPSPEPSININMNDYDSSDDDEVSASEIGATFYRNLMGQVNDILRKAQGQTKENYKEGQKDKLKNQTMNKVREATLKHLRNIGVTIGPIEETYEDASCGSDGIDYTPTEISFAVKQLLLKYLPDDQLAKITYKQAQSVPFNKTAKQNVIPNRPEFSFATVEYMKKYNLISNSKDVKRRDVEQIPKTPISQKTEGPKILDITALKMQPKLL